MKKFFAILFSVLTAIFVSSCDYQNPKAESHIQEISVSEPVQESSDDISKISESESSLEEESPKSEFYYVLNTRTKKIHLPSCRSAHEIAEKNYATANDLQAALDEGYKKCKNCNPQ